MEFDPWELVILTSLSDTIFYALIAYKVSPNVYAVLSMKSVLPLMVSVENYDAYITPP